MFDFIVNSRKCFFKIWNPDWAVANAAVLLLGNAAPTEFTKFFTNLLNTAWYVSEFLAVVEIKKIKICNVFFRP